MDPLGQTAMAERCEGERIRNESLSMRIDSAHSSTPAAAQPDPLDLDSDEALEAALDANHEGTSIAYFRRHASELTSRLRDWQSELERRESELNARLADSESELRAARLLLSNRQQQIEHRERELCQQVQLAATIPLTLEKTDVDEKMRLLNRRAELDRREVELQRQLEAFQQERSRFEVEQANVAQAVAADKEQAQRLRHESEERLRDMESTQDAHRREMVRREMSLHRIYEQTRQLHQENLELQICLEEISANSGLTGDDLAANQLLSPRREQLADSYRVAQETVVQERQQIEHLLSRLAEQSGELQRRRQELQCWIDRRESDLEGQAQKLILRQQQLDDLQRQLHAQEADWNRERVNLQQQLQRAEHRLWASASGQLG